MQSQWIDKTFLYDGQQLAPLFAYLNYGVCGDSIIAWRGPCDIPFQHMVDGEDVINHCEIRGGDMVHFIIEVFAVDLLGAVALQRLFAAMVLDYLRENAPKSEFHREGDDIYCGDGKVSISIASKSTVSAMIHFAVNVTNENTPVKTAALNDFNVDPATFAATLMTRFCAEFKSARVATQKVRPL